jgi:serine phosphatase RsbU (regulator of sigma subunit)
MACTNALDRSVRELGFVRPADIIETARQFVVETFMRSASTMQDGMDCCLCSLSYLPVGGAEVAEHIAELAYAGANRPLLLLRQGATQVDVLRTDRQPVGGNVAPTPFTEQRIALAEGDTVYLFTDGITDQFGGNGDRKFSLGALKELLLRVRGMSMEEQRTAIAQALAEWRTGREQVDDMCMLGVRISRLDQLILAPNSPAG